MLWFTQIDGAQNFITESPTQKKRNRGFFGGILMDVKGDKNSVAKILA